MTVHRHSGFRRLRRGRASLDSREKRLDPGPLDCRDEARVHDDRSDLLQGTLELLVLKTVSVEPMHGWGITQRIELVSRNVLQVNQGSLYPALERLRRRGWIRSEWRLTENNRRARYYYLTPAGRRQLDRQRETWQRASSAVNWILQWSGEMP